MGFLRQNIFYVALIGVIVLAGAGMGFLYVRWTGEWEKKLSERTQLRSELDRLARAEKVNPELIEAERTRVESFRQARAQVAETAAKWNQHEPIKIPQVNAQGETETVAAFPFEGEMSGTARFAFTEQYIREMRQLLQELDSTRPPTDAEIADQVDKAVQRIRQQRKLEARQSVAVMGRQPAQIPSAEAQDIQEQAKQEGFLEAVVSRAKGGAVYATENALDMTIQTPMPGVTNAEMWQAQLNLWAQRDIIEAIKRTNQVVHERSGGDDELHVLNSAVKRLVGVQVEEDYFTGGRQTGGGRTTGGGGADEWRRPADDWGRPGDDWGRPGDDWGRPGGGAARPTPPGQPGQPAAGPAAPPRSTTSSITSLRSSYPCATR